VLVDGIDFSDDKMLQGRTFLTRTRGVTGSALFYNELFAEGEHSMNSLAYDYAAGIFSTAGAPCLSLYQPTHRRHPENQQDPIRFRNLLRALEQSLRQKYATRDVRPLMEPFQRLAEDRGFWNHVLDGLAVLAA
jgi:hypothetical protein